MSASSDQRESESVKTVGSRDWQAIAETASFWLLIATLAWAPFPLGSNRPWSWTLLTFLVVICWLLWLPSAWRAPHTVALLVRRIAGPILLALLALLWGVVQTLAWVPASWTHPVWQIAVDGLNKPASAMISLNGWRTLTELMKLATYVMAGWLAYSHCQRVERAQRLLDALIAIGAAYATYALVMAMLNIKQIQVFYDTAPDGSSPVAAPFVTHAAFATFMGMSFLSACVRLFALGSENIVTIRGPRQLFLTTLKFVFGRGTPLVIATLLLFSMLVASASRAGFLATLIGAILLFVLSSLTRSSGSWRWSAVAVTVTITFGALLLALNGDTLQGRFNDVVASGETLGLRTPLWDAASHMIDSAPWRGLGLGNFERAYPQYADQVYPFNMDKAHNDYLETAAGWGLPAAIAWCGAVLWLAALCGRGALTRRRNRSYPLVAASTTALVAFHTLFDFTMQIPADALIFSAILGIGAAQAFSSRS